MGLLALLAERPSHGYQLKAGFEERTGGVWPLNVGQLGTKKRHQAVHRRCRRRRLRLDFGVTGQFHPLKRFPTRFTGRSYYTIFAA